MNTTSVSAQPTTWQAQLETYTSEEFIQSGKHVEIPQAFKDKMAAFAKEHPERASDINQSLAAIEKWADFVNEQLGSNDLSEAEKKDFMATFFNESSDDLEDPGSGVIGRILSAAVSGDEGAFNEMFDDNWLADELRQDDVKAIDDDRQKTFKEWREANGIQRPADKGAINALNKIFGEQRATLDEYKGMTIAEAAERMESRPTVAKPA